MSFHFRKSIKIAPGLKVNLSKSGIGMSAGVRGARVGMNSRGTYSSVGVPGTGIYAMSYGSSGTSRSSKSPNAPEVAAISSRIIQTKTGSGLVWVVVIDVVLLLIQWIVGLVAIALTVVWYLHLKKQPLYQAKERLRDAQTAYKMGEYQKAAEEFEVSYTSFPDDKAIALLTASSYSQLHKFDRAVKFMEEYLATYPEDIEMQKVLAHWYDELGEKDTALRILQSLDVEQAKDADTLLLMADLFSSKGLDAVAIDVLKRAPLTKRTLTPELIDIIYALGLLYEKNGDKRRAQSSFERVYAYDASFKDVAKKVK